MDWLPERIRVEDFDGDLDAFENAAYESFCRDWVYASAPTFMGKRVRFRNGTTPNGRDYGYWHLVTEGEQESLRELAVRRCERIGWVRAIIEHAETDDTCTWKDDRRGAGDYLIALPDFSYLVVLSPRRGYWLLVTAYEVEHHHRRRKKRKEFEKSR